MSDPRDHDEAIEAITMGGIRIVPLRQQAPRLVQGARLGRHRTLHFPEAARARSLRVAVARERRRRADESRRGTVAAIFYSPRETAKLHRIDPDSAHDVKTGRGE